METSMEIYMPDMPATSVCINESCDIFMFLNGLFCPQCNQRSMYKVETVTYSVTRQ